MRLTTHTDYALRVLIRLALQPQELVTIAEIARFYRISENHLMKVVHQLGIAGYVETVRGHGGGLRLAQSPATIVVGDVVRRTEPDLRLVECFRVPGSCVIEPACALSGLLGAALDAFLAVLDRHTLADLVRERGPLAELLNPTATPAHPRQK
jgi:Rrf2 family nitric oxide-sensitive transcriptional repressor